MVLETDLHTNYELTFARSARFMHEIYMTFSPLAPYVYLFIYIIYCTYIMVSVCATHLCITFASI